MIFIFFITFYISQIKTDNLESIYKKLRKSGYIFVKWNEIEEKSKYFKFFA